MIILFELDNNFDFFFIIIEFSIKPSCDPNAPPPRDRDLGRDLNLRTADVKGEYVLEMNDSSKTQNY